MEELEEVTAIVSGGRGLEGHLEAAADLHRAVSRLWEGVSDVISSLSEADSCYSSRSGTKKTGSDPPSTDPEPASRELATIPQASAGGVFSDNNASEKEESATISKMIRDQELLDLPMHLEDLPLTIVTDTLSIDANRVEASAKYLISGILSTLSAGAGASAAEAAVVSSHHNLPLISDPNKTNRKPLVRQPPKAPPPALEDVPADDVKDETESTPGSGREDLSILGSEERSSGGGEEESTKTPSTGPRDGPRSSDDQTEEGSGSQTEGIGVIDVALVVVSGRQWSSSLSLLLLCRWLFMLLLSELDDNLSRHVPVLAKSCANHQGISEGKTYKVRSTHMYIHILSSFFLDMKTTQDVECKTP